MLSASVKSQRTVINSVARRRLYNTRTKAFNAPRGTRFQSTSAGPTQPSSSHVVAGLAGGGITLAGVYGWYHYSGLKSVVDTSKSVQQSVKSAASSVSQKLPSDPNEALQYLRSFTKSYVGVIPGAAATVDSSFDTLEELRHSHGDKVDKLIQETYDQLKKTAQSGGMDAKTANRVLEILKEQGIKLGEIAKDVGMDVLEKHPEVKEKLGGGWDELQRLAKDAGDSDIGKRARKISDDTSKTLSEIFQKGFSAESISKAKELIETKTKEVKELMDKAARQAWDKGMEEYGDKLPDSVRSVLSDNNNVTALLSAGGGAGGIAAVASVWDRVKEMASKKGGFDEKSIEEFKKFVQDKASQGKSSGAMGLDAAWSQARSWLSSVPGGEKALKQVGDVDVSQLVKIAQSRGEESEKLLQETYGDLLKVLKEKAEKAKKLAEKTKDQAKDSKQ